jgi:hypothetical protein
MADRTARRKRCGSFFAAGADGIQHTGRLGSPIFRSSGFRVEGPMNMPGWRLYAPAEHEVFVGVVSAAPWEIKIKSVRLGG